MMRACLVWLAACTSSQTPTMTGSTALSGSTGTSAATAETGIEAPRWATPAEAVDIDPNPAVVHIEITATPHRWAVGDQVVEGYAFNGQVPGPTIRANLGDTLVVDFVNDTELRSSVHWHGLSVPYAMDGAGWRIDPVMPGGGYRYTFPLTQAGTFWYHPHFDTARSVDLGLYGVVVVADPSDPPVDADVVAVFDSLAEEEAEPDHHGVKASPTRWIVNGVSRPTWQPQSGSTVRMRLLNVSNQGYLSLEGLRVVGGDQGLLPIEADAVILPPGDRAEVLWEVGAASSTVETWPWSLAGPGVGEPTALFDVTPLGDEPAPAVTWPSNPVPPSPDPGRTDLRYVFTGSSAEGWEINGQTFPDIDVDEVALGSQIILEIRNLSPAHHPFHLHGMELEVLSVNGVAPAQRRIEDTFDVAVRDTVRLRIDADNPGDWMSHCHILPHAERGMMTVLRVK